MIYIYIHIFDLLIKFPIFSKNFSARRTYGSAVEQASTKPGPKPESRYGVCCRHGRHGMIGGWWDGHRWTKQLIKKKRGKKRAPTRRISELVLGMPWRSDLNDSYDSLLFACSASAAVRLPGALSCQDLTAFGFKSQNLHDLRLPVAGNIIWFVIPCDSSYDKYIFFIYDYL
jgi:hypothetical protein